MTQRTTTIRCHQSDPPHLAVHRFDVTKKFDGKQIMELHRMTCEQCGKEQGAGVFFYPRSGR